MAHHYRATTSDGIVHYARRYDPSFGTRVFAPWCWPYAVEANIFLREGSRSPVLVTCLTCLAKRLGGVGG